MSAAARNRKLTSGQLDDQPERRGAVHRPGVEAVLALGVELDRGRANTVSEHARHAAQHPQAVHQVVQSRDVRVPPGLLPDRPRGVEREDEASDGQPTRLLDGGFGQLVDDTDIEQVEEELDAGHFTRVRLAVQLAVLDPLGLLVYATFWDGRPDARGD